MVQDQMHLLFKTSSYFHFIVPRETFFYGLFPCGRGRREATGEGLRSLLGPQPLTRFAAQIDLSPPGRGDASDGFGGLNADASRAGLADRSGGEG